MYSIRYTLGMTHVRGIIRRSFPDTFFPPPSIEDVGDDYDLRLLPSLQATTLHHHAHTHAQQTHAHASTTRALPPGHM